MGLNHDVGSAANILRQEATNNVLPLVKRIRTEDRLGKLYILNPDHPKVKEKVESKLLVAWRDLINHETITEETMDEQQVVTQEYSPSDDSGQFDQLTAFLAVRDVIAALQCDPQANWFPEEMFPYHLVDLLVQRLALPPSRKGLAAHLVFLFRKNEVVRVMNESGGARKGDKWNVYCVSHLMRYRWRFKDRFRDPDFLRGEELIALLLPDPSKRSKELAVWKAEMVKRLPRLSEEVPSKETRQGVDLAPSPEVGVPEERPHSPAKQVQAPEGLINDLTDDDLDREIQRLQRERARRELRRELSEKEQKLAAAQAWEVSSKETLHQITELYREAERASDEAKQAVAALEAKISELTKRLAAL